MKHCFVLISIIGLSLLLLTGCPPKAPMGEVPEYDRPLAHGDVALRKITDLAEVPDLSYSCSNLKGLVLSVDRSLEYLAKPSSKNYFPYGQITHHHAVESLKAFKAICEADKGPAAMESEILGRFDFYTSVGWDGSGTVLFTSYYTPVFKASLKPSAVYRYPLYSAPANLEKDHVGTILGLRQDDGSLIKVPARAQLESSGILAGSEVIYLADKFEAYIAHVQGSVKFKLPDGKIIAAGYSANNGWDYHSVGEEMIAAGLLTGKEKSLGSMIAYFKSHPEQIDTYVNRNPRFVFFSLGSGEPTGCLGAPVTPMRSVATDKAIYPRACLAMIEVPLPTDRGLADYSGFVLDQDRGGAIRAPGRCDLYIGVGDRAGRLAGKNCNEGRLYYLFLKSDQVPPPVIRPVE